MLRALTNALLYSVVGVSRSRDQSGYGEGFARLQAENAPPISRVLGQISGRFHLFLHRRKQDRSLCGGYTQSSSGRGYARQFCHRVFQQRCDRLRRKDKRIEYRANNIRSGLARVRKQSDGALRGYIRSPAKPIISSARVSSASEQNVRHSKTRPVRRVRQHSICHCDLRPADTARALASPQTGEKQSRLPAKARSTENHKPHRRGWIVLRPSLRLCRLNSTSIIARLSYTKYNT